MTKMKLSENADIRIVSDEGELRAGRRAPGQIIAPILCLFGAIIIWLYVMANDSPNYEQTFYSIPVSLVGVSDLSDNTGMSVVSGKGHMVDVTISGKKSDVVGLSADDISAYVNVGDLSTSAFHSLEVSVAVPSGLSVSSCSPDTVLVNVDRTSSFMIPVVAKLSSYIIDNDRIIGNPVPKDEEISVSGPVTVLNTIDHAEVILNDLGQVTATLSAVGNITLVDSNGNEVSSKYLKISQDTVEVTVPVSMYKDVPINVVGKYGFYNSENVVFTVEPKTLRVKGDAEVMSDLEGYDVVIDEKKMYSDTTVKEAISLPENVENVDKIETVSVSVKHIGTAVAVVPDVININIYNPKGINCKLITESLDIRLRGPSDTVSKVSPSDVTVVADMSNLSSNSGKVTVPVRISVNPRHKDVYELDVYKVELEIE